MRLCGDSLIYRVWFGPVVATFSCGQCLPFSEEVTFERSHDWFSLKNMVRDFTRRLSKVDVASNLLACGRCNGTWADEDCLVTSSAAAAIFRR